MMKLSIPYVDWFHNPYTMYIYFNPFYHTAVAHMDMVMYIEDLQDCSCFIECIKQVGEKQLNARHAEHFIAFCNKFNKFNNTGARMLGIIYHMTLKVLKISFLA